MKAPSEFPTVAASPLLSVCIVASPVTDDIGLPAVPPRSPSETPPRLVSQWPGWFPHRLRLRHGYYALASMLPTGRHSGRSGRTVHENAVSYSAWHTHIACVGVLVLFRWGCWPFPACPRTYLLASTIKARPPPSSVLSCTPSPVHRASRTPSRHRALSAFRPYMLGLARRGCQVGSPLFRAVLSQRATACDPGEIQHPFRPRMLSVAFSVV